MQENPQESSFNRLRGVPTPHTPPPAYKLYNSRRNRSTKGNNMTYPYLATHPSRLPPLYRERVSIRSGTQAQAEQTVSSNTGTDNQAYFTMQDETEPSTSTLDQHPHCSNNLEVTSSSSYSSVDNSDNQARFPTFKDDNSNTPISYLGEDNSSTQLSRISVDIESSFNHPSLIFAEIVQHEPANTTGTLDNCISAGDNKNNFEATTSFTNTDNAPELLDNHGSSDKELVLGTSNCPASMAFYDRLGDVTYL